MLKKSASRPFKLLPEEVKNHGRKKDKKEKSSKTEAFLEHSSHMAQYLAALVTLIKGWQVIKALTIRRIIAHISVLIT